VDSVLYSFLEGWRTLITLLPYYVFRRDIESQECNGLELASLGNGVALNQQSCGANSCPRAPAAQIHLQECYIALPSCQPSGDLDSPFPYRAALAASATAIAVARMLLRDGPDFHVGTLGNADAETRPLFFVLGGLAGLLAIAHNRTLLATMAAAERFGRLPVEARAGLSQCRSLTELGNLQSSFLSQFANDYMQETEKLAKPVADLAQQVTLLVPPHR
jgi:hypothetical protein